MELFLFLDTDDSAAVNRATRMDCDVVIIDDLVDTTAQNDKGNFALLKAICSHWSTV